MADKIGMPRSTYAKKEAESDFTEEEILSLAKVIGGKDKLLELHKKIIKIEDWKEFLIKSAINNNATQRVILRTLAEILDKQTGKGLPEILNRLTRAVEEEKALHPMR